MYKSLEPYAKLVDFLSAALGDNCEVALHDLTSTIKKILGIKEEKDIEFKMDNPVEILSSPLDEMIDMYIKECLEKMGFPSYFLAERLNVDEKIKVVKYLQEKGTFKVKGAIVLVAEKLAVSEPTVYRYLKKNV